MSKLMNFKEPLWLSFIIDEEQQSLPLFSGMMSYELHIVFKTLTIALKNVRYRD